MAAGSFSLLGSCAHANNDGRRDLLRVPVEFTNRGVWCKPLLIFTVDVACGFRAVYARARCGVTF